MSIQTAREKIEKEAASADATTKRIAEYIIVELLKSEENAEKILVDGKTLMGAVNQITQNAKKAAGRSSMAMIDDNEVFGWVREYFNISDLTVVKQDPEPQQPYMSLFDLLE